MDNPERERLRMRLVTIREAVADEDAHVRECGVRRIDGLIAEQKPVEKPGARKPRKVPVATDPTDDATGQGRC